MYHTIDFDQAPLLVIWEVTRSCALACKHCRADAINQRDPRELSLEEGCALLDKVADMGTPLFVFSGGDPLQRDDLEDLIRHAKSRGLKVGTIPAATPRLTRERVRSLKNAGLDQLALSLDGATREQHDSFRGVPGSFERTMRGAEFVHDEGLRLQINTVFSKWNATQFDEIAALVESLNIVFWEVFFLIPTGRGALLDSCSSEEFEMLFEKLYEFSKLVPFTVKITEAPHYRRYIREYEKNRTGTAQPIRACSRSVNAGRGFCFVDHVGNVCPSGFLPIPAGNVREDSIISLYRYAPLFRELRDSSRLTGRCGSCEYRDSCSGSRSRAYAVTGDYFQEEPFCAFAGE